MEALRESLAQASLLASGGACDPQHSLAAKCIPQSLPQHHKGFSLSVSLRVLSSS